MRNKIIQGAIIGLVSAAVALSLQFMGLLGWLENPLWDWRVQAMAELRQSNSAIKTIFLDQSSLDWGEKEMMWSWPWPRIVYEPIISFCQRGGAKAIVFDVLFTEPSERIEEDTALGNAIAGATGFVSAVFLGREQGDSLKWPAEIDVTKYDVTGLNDYLSHCNNQMLIMPRAAFPIPDVARNSDILGNVSSGSDADAKIRRVGVFRVFDGHFIPSLGLAAYLAGNPDVKLKLDDKLLHVGNSSIPLDRNGDAILRYRKSSKTTNRTVSAAAVIQSELLLREGGKPQCDPEFFRNAYVFLGFTAPGLVDLKATPVSRYLPGVEIQATVLDNLLSNDFIRDVDSGWMVLFALLFGLASGLTGRACANARQMVAALLVTVIAPILIGFGTYHMGYCLQVGVLDTIGVFSLVSAVIVNYAIEGKKKRFIKNAFKQYLSPDVIEKLLQNPGNLKLGGELRELSIYFSDVQGFTSISESLTPDNLTTLLNDYLTAMTDIIMDEGGTVDKYEGDAIIAFWNAPLDVPDHAKRAVRAALRCGKKLAELRPGFKERAGRDLFMRIGLNTGQVVVGNMGSNQRFDYTFLGDAGNLAARLEGINKQFGTYIMISENTLKQIGDEFAVRELSRVRVVGRKEPVRVFEPMFKEDYSARRNILDVFSSALKQYYDGKFDTALELFSSIAEHDPASSAYAKRCKHLKEHPPQDWSGIWEMTEK